KPADAADAAALALCHLAVSPMHRLLAAAASHPPGASRAR
ncbi:MAG: crossover junction endodeoxyribonuclease RuvC, partial [Acidimicrobiia bacterium]|nr:crossover junction endodeoxyribonuclease RuvC [Acidimicrobiia bacterium]